MADSSYPLDEVMIAAMASELSGEVLVSSVTAFGALAAQVAKATHAPELALLSSPESGMDVDFVPTVGLSQFFTAAERGITLGMEEVFDAIFLDRFRIWINPAQIDRLGNVNISVVGRWHSPKVALVGSRGIPEDTSHLSRLCYYLVDHSPRTVVAAVDFRSGGGNTDERRQSLGRLGAPSVLVTNLGVFGFDGEDGQMRIQSLHPGVSVDMVQEASGFAVEAPATIPVTPLPSAEVSAFIRIRDPLGLRHMEMAKGAAASQILKEAYAAESKLLATAPTGGAPRG